jgi:hypothetical protein
MIRYTEFLLGTIVLHTIIKIVGYWASVLFSLKFY